MTFVKNGEEIKSKLTICDMAGSEDTKAIKDAFFSQAMVDDEELLKGGKYGTENNEVYGFNVFPTQIAVATDKGEIHPPGFDSVKMLKFRRRWSPY